jgi:hypothetical protein
MNTMSVKNAKFLNVTAGGTLTYHWPLKVKVIDFWNVMPCSLIYGHQCFEEALPPQWGHAVAQLVETLRYKPEGREFNPRWCHRNFSLT